ncbi:copper amine oxidase N-terminal domain-containing protein, partial [bacterium]
RSFEGAAFSGSTSSPSTRLSAKTPLLAKNETRKSAAAGKPANPDAKRIAALPRPFKKDQGGAINAIIVSPIEIRTSDAIPAFHVAARASDLRAVAARYGLPVEVVAACNAWPENKTLVAGEKVKLPQQLKVSYQGVPVKSDAPSMLVGGTGVTAFRFLFQQAGGKLEWDAKKQRVIAKKGESEVVLTIGSNKAKVGDKDVMMELAAFLFEGRTMVPVRFFEEGLRAQVEWDPQTGRLVVAMAN